MKRYIDADRLKAEIEKRKIANQQDATESGAGAFYEDKAILDLLDSLQQVPSCETCTNDKGCVTCKDGELWEGKEQPYEELEEENVDVKESPLKTFPRTNEFDTGSSYRR